LFFYSKDRLTVSKISEGVVAFQDAVTMLNSALASAGGRVR
jgi:hypothetical protein